MAVQEAAPVTMKGLSLLLLLNFFCFAFLSLGVLDMPALPGGAVS
jgi:hypothetical protein